MLELFRAKSGDVTASVSGGLLHSRYDPMREAERYLDRALGEAARGGRGLGEARESLPATILLLGPGLGYLTSAIRRRLPKCHLIAVSALNAVQPDHKENVDVYVDLSAGDPARLLSRALRPADVSGLELLEWEPELRAAPDAAAAARAAVRELVARYNAEVATTAFFGQRYIKNAVRTLLFAEDARTPAPGVRPICIAASGPSLEQSWRWIAENRAAVEVWALSSATPALRARGITADALVHQDAGYYATLHLAETARDAASADSPRSGSPEAETPPVLMPSTAALPPRELRSTPILFDQGTAIEKELFTALGIDPTRITETGTVAATATLLALDRSPGTVYLSGLDLSRRDIRAHATPHAFEPYLLRRESRLRPLYSQLAAEAFERTEGRRTHASGRDQGRAPKQRARTERSLDVYAAWFRNLPPDQARRLRRLSPSPVDLGIEAVGPEEHPPAAAATATRGGDRAAGSSSTVRTGWEPLPLPPRGERIAALRGVVEGWRGEIRRFTVACADPNGPDQEDACSEVTGRGAELAYLIAAADYVAAVAAGRRGDEASRARSLERVSETAEELFTRLESILSRLAERPS